MVNRDVIKVLIVLTFSLFPFAISWVLLSKIKQRWQARFRRVCLMTSYPQMVEQQFEIGEQPRETEQYYLGDLSCRFNANSPYMRCAVNPDGPCEGCRYYESK
jgi:hypothetical protein